MLLLHWRRIATRIGRDRVGLDTRRILGFEKQKKQSPLIVELARCDQSITQIDSDCLGKQYAESNQEA